MRQLHLTVGVDKTAHCDKKHAYRCMSAGIDLTNKCDEDASNIDWIERTMHE